MKKLLSIIAVASLAFLPTLSQGNVATSPLSILISPANATTPIDWINIKDYGAVGDGVTDDTAHIQAAIDAAFANNVNTVYCPATASAYNVTDTLWLDPPTNMRATTWTGTGTINGSAFHRLTTTSGSLVGGEYIHGSGTFGGTMIIGGSDPNWIVTNDFSQVVSGSLTAFNPTVPTQGQFTMAFRGDNMSGGSIGGGVKGKCVIQATMGSVPTLVMGSGQSMYVGNIGVRGGGFGLGYRGGQPATGGGIAIQGGSSGSSSALVENTDVEGFYNCYVLDPFANEPLADSNTFRKVSASNCFNGINLAGTQSFINMIYDPRIGNSTIGINNSFSHQVEVYGGNISANGGAYNTFNISGTSTLFNTTPCPGAGHECFQTTIASPDSYVNTVYNAYTITTTQHGILPLDMVAWNPATNLATFELHYPWVLSSYGQVATPDPVFSSDIQAVTQLLATERVEVFHGSGINATGTHIENSNGCTALFNLNTVWSGSNRSSIADPLFDYDVSLVSQAPAPQFKCQAVFSLIGTTQDTPFYVNLDGGNYSGTMALNPVIIELPQQATLKGQHLSAATMSPLPQFNPRVWDSTACSYGMVDDPQGLGAPYCNGLNLQTVARGMGIWDQDYFLPTLFHLEQVANSSSSEATGPYCGFELCPWEVPQMPTNVFAKVCPGTIGGGLTVGSPITCSGSLGTLGTYMPISPRTAYKYLDYNTGTLTRPLFIRSSNGGQPGYSWGKTLNAASIGGSTQNITASIAGTTLTITAGGPVVAGSMVVGTSVPTGTYVVDVIDATHARLNHSVTVASEAMTIPPQTWAFQGGSNTVYLDSYFLRYMFPGLGITLNGNNYIVTGAYPAFGYATVIYAGAPGGGALQGTGPFSCTTSCSLGQAAYAWSAY